MAEATPRITAKYLEQFQGRTVRIVGMVIQLRGDAATVGAYNIVPLAGIVSEFSEWMTLMEWLWNISAFLASPKDDGSGRTPASGASVIDKLRTEAQTGYAEIERAARGLSGVAETCWLRQLSTWLLHGRLPALCRSYHIVCLSTAVTLSPTCKTTPTGLANPYTPKHGFMGNALFTLRSFVSSL